MSRETDRFQCFVDFTHKTRYIVLVIITYSIGEGKSVKSIEFTVAAHIMAALGYFLREDIYSAALADIVNADTIFVRKSLSKLSKVSVVTKRSKRRASVLRGRSRCWTYAVPVTAPPMFAIHYYPVEKRRPVSCNLKE
jgi:hypothetical protein